MPDVKASPDTRFPLSKHRIAAQEDAEVFIDLINTSTGFKSTLSRKHYFSSCASGVPFAAACPRCLSWRKARLPSLGTRS